MNGQIQYDHGRALTSEPTPAPDSAAPDTDPIEFAARIFREGLPVIAPVGHLPPGERCHFAAPARFGRRRSDQIGQLELTSGWLKFHGALDLSVVWAEIAAVVHEGHDIVVSLIDSRRELRFCCPGLDEAARGAVVARHLAFVIGAQASDSHPDYQSAL